ncbi:PKD domain-containing protein [Natronorubrum tibetense]|uniref:CHRD domain containing protein n=1 Tax=Natronorubrum tibetense GA33 TaxID=1114856 RepID=L9VL73_9EURY|nr:PKD domain-containing protein [Natronorubrum tibetense]ELY37826.1 CHRD domain containing protein [Natronorubrum tibetense GA33]
MAVAETATIETDSTNTTDGDTIVVSGQLTLPDGEPAPGGMVLVITDNGTETMDVDDDGSYELTLPEQDEPHDVQYYHDSDLDFPHDGVADVYAISSVPGNEDTELGTTQLPMGHLVEATVVTPDGEPVADADVSLQHINKAANASAGFGGATNDDGVFYPREPPGLELNGTVEVEVQPPEDDNRFVEQTSERTLDVTENKTPEIELEQKDLVAQIDTEPSAPDVNEEITFDGTESIGEIKDYEWEFGDGENDTGDNVTHSFDEINTHEVTLTVTDDEGETATTTESMSVGGHTLIEHSDGSTTSGDGMYADIPTIHTSEYGEAIDIGGDADTAFQIHNTDTGESITVTPKESDDTVSAEFVDFFLYDSSGAIDPDEDLAIWAQGEDGDEEIPVDVAGDLEMFENEDTFSPYEVALVDTEHDGAIDTTDERLMGIGYEAEFEQDGTEGEVNVTIPRDDEVNEEWDVTFGVYGEHAGEMLVEQSVANDADADVFEFTVDVSDIDDGEYTWGLDLEKSEQEPHVQWLYGHEDFTVGEGALEAAFDVDPTEPELGETVTFDASASSGDIEAYEWTFGDGTEKTGETVNHTFDDVDTHEVELTITDADGATATTTESVSVGGHTLIEHSDGSTTSGDGMFADQPTIRVGEYGETFEVGGEADTAFQIRNTDTNESVTVTPDDSADTVSANYLDFSLYKSSGELRDAEDRTVRAIGSEDTVELPVTVEGDLEMFETEETFSTYEVTLVDTEHDEPIDTTDERLMGIGYEAELEQDGTAGEINVTIPRDDEVNEEWNVTFGVYGEHAGETLVERSVENDADADAFEFTVDVRDIDGGEYTWGLEIEKPEQEPHVQWLYAYEGFTVGEGEVNAEFDVEPTEPELGETVSFDASASSSDIDSYEWTFSDGTEKTGETVNHTFDDVDIYEVELTVIDSSGETATTTETVSVGGHTAIEHGDGAGTSGDGMFADAPTIRTSEFGETVDIGGDADTAFQIRNTDTDESVTVTPNESADTVSADWVSFFLYDSSGEMIPDEAHVRASGTESGETLSVDLEGDLELFENENTFATYEVALIDGDGEPIDSAGERLMGVGYEAELEQDGTEDEVNVTIPRDDEIDESWNVTFELLNTETGEIITKVPVENDADATTFEFTVDVSDIEDGEYTWELALDKSDQDPLVQRIHDVDDFIIGDIEREILIEPYFEVSDETPSVDDDVTFDASDAIALEDDEEIEFDSYSWDFDDGTETTMEDSVTNHTFDEPGEYNVTATFSAGGETKTDTRTVTVSEPVDPASLDVDDLEPVEKTVEQGDDIDVSATVTNTGDEEATQKVKFDLDDEVLGTKSVTLGAGETETVTFEDIDTAGLDPDEYTYGVFSEDDSQTSVLTVMEPAFFAVTIDESDVPDEIGQGDELAVPVTVENTGDESDIQRIELDIDDDVDVDAEEVELTGGESEQVTLTHNVSADAVAEETAVEVRSADDEATTTVDIYSTENYTIQSVDTSAPVTVGDVLEFDVKIENVGDGVDSQTLEFEIGDETHNETVAIDPGATETHTFEYETNGSDTPGVSADVTTEDDETTVSARVQSAEPATVEILDADVPTDATQGETINVDATVENTGDLEGEDTVELYVGDDVVVTESIELDGGETETVSLEYELPHEPRAGVQSVDVTTVTTDDVAFETLEVDYETIESGLTEAEAGDTVSVGAGTYEESVTVETADVHIQAIDGADATVLDPVDDVGIAIEAENVTVDRFTIDGDGSGTGIAATAENAELIRNAFVGLETGVHLNASDDHSVAHNTFTASVETAILVTASDDNVLERNTIYGESEIGIATTDAGTDNDGIVIADGADGTVIERNTLDVGGDAIVLESDAGGANTGTSNNLEGDNLSVANHLNPTTFEGNANYYDGDLDDRTIGEVEDDPVEDRYEEATYDVEIGEVTETVAVGDKLEVEATIENEGDYEGLQDVVLELDGTVVATADDLTVAEDDAASVELTYAPTDEDIDEDVSLTVRSDDDADDTSVTVQSAPVFDVFDLDAPPEAEQGEDVQVTATVENLGGEATQDLELRLGDDLTDDDSYTVLDTASTTLEENETVVSSNATIPDDDAAGMALLGVASEDELDETTFDILEADEEEKEEEGSGAPALPPAPSESATFEIGSIDLPTTVEPGQELTITAPVENVGEEAGITGVIVTVSDDVIAEETVDLDAGADETVTFDVTAPEAPGDVDVVIQMPDSETTGTFTVEADDEVDDDDAATDPAEEDDSDPETDDEPADDGTATDSVEEDDSEPETDDSVPGFGVVMTVVALLVATVTLGRYRH